MNHSVQCNRYLLIHRRPVNDLRCSSQASVYSNVDLFNFLSQGLGDNTLLAFIVWEQVYSRGKFVLKASHWSRNVHWDIVVVKSFGGKFATCSDGNYRGLKFSPMGANMKTRLESKIVCNSRKQAVLLTKFGCNIHLAALSKFLIYFCSIRGHVTF